MAVKRGEIYFADLGPVIGSEQGGIRPVLIIQNDIGNVHSGTTIISPITSSQSKRNIPTHVLLGKGEGGLSKPSIIELEQIKVVDKSRLKSKMGSLSAILMSKVDKAIDVSLGRMNNSAGAPIPQC